MFEQNSSQQRIRPAAVAGMFYPGNPAELQTMVTDMLTQAGDLDTDINQPVAVIAPHAGYIYSGPVAATAYRYIGKFHQVIKRVILLGPSHRVPFTGLAMSSATHFSTPLGLIPIDTDSYRKIAEHPAVQLLDAAHAQEHSLEVHLPFLQSVLDDFCLVPLVVGDTSKEDVAKVLELLDLSTDTLVVVSSDLSHYHDYRRAQQLDQDTSNAIVHLQPEKIGYEDACGRNPVNGLLTLAKQHHLHVIAADLRNSGDTAGPRDRVVGYGAYLFH
jgi:AmmeMemoRadiSam system protein B